MIRVSAVPEVHRPHNQSGHKTLPPVAVVRRSLVKIEGNLGGDAANLSPLTTGELFIQGNPPLNFPGNYPTT